MGWMKAAVRTRYGAPGVVRIAEVDRPRIGPRDLLVRILVTTVNRTDCGFRAGHPWIVRLFAGPLRPRVPALGSEFAGEVEAVGPEVSAFQIGDRVFGFSEDRWGAHAEYLAIPEDGAVATIPDGVSLDEAAAATEGSHYALSDIRAARVTAGQEVLVHGATGAIGSAAVQLLKDIGATVTATAATAHVELVRDLGADRVIDRSAQDFTRDAGSYDFVFDAVGKSSFRRCRRLLKPRGIFISTDLGPWSLNPLLAIVTAPMRKRVRFPVPGNHDGAGVRWIAERLASGAFRPVIDRRYRLHQIVEAYRYVEGGEKIGNVVIDVGPGPEAGSGP